MKYNFFKNSKGQLIYAIGGAEALPETLVALLPNTVEASGEKHIPVVTLEDGAVNVNVGAVDHPMGEEHFIEWVWLETDKGGQLKKLLPGAEPNVTFTLGEEKPLAVYAYCNLHGLWKTEL